MSLFPCDGHGARITGRLGAAYPSLLRGPDRLTRRMRMCDACLDLLIEKQELGLSQVDELESAPFGAKCNACAAALEADVPSYPLFVTLYRRGTEREDWAALLCGGCADNAHRSLRLGA